MVEIAESTTIDRRPDDVWAALADFGAIGRWAPNVDHSCLTTDRSTGVDAVRRVQVGRNTLLERIVEWGPTQQLSYVIEGLPPVIRSVTNTWRLEPAGSGSAVTITSKVEAGPRPPQRVVARLVAKRMAGESQKMLAGLKTHLEGEEAP